MILGLGVSWQTGFGSLAPAETRGIDSEGSEVSPDEPAQCERRPTARQGYDSPSHVIVDAGSFSHYSLSVWCSQCRSRIV